MSYKKMEALIRRAVQADTVEQSKIFTERSKELSRIPIPEESLLRFRKTIDSRKMKKRKRSLFSIFRDKRQK